MVTKPRIVLACRNLDGTAAVIRGQVGVSGFDLNVQEENNPPVMFDGMFHGKYDASEMSLAETVYYISRNKADFIGIPVFLSRVFRHSFLFCRAGSDIEGGPSLNGKRLGFERWVQTAGVWQRGFLVDEYGVVPQEKTWHVMGIHHWEDASEGPVVPRNGTSINQLKHEGSHYFDAYYNALKDGRLDAIGTTEGQQGRMSSLAVDGQIKRVFPNYREAEAAYYKKTGIFPIMHLLTIRRSVAEQYPELPEALFRMFSESKKRGTEFARSLPSYTLAWKHGWQEEEDKVFTEDPWPHGLAANRHTVDTFLRYCWEQGISARQMEAADLFLPATWGLAE